MPCPSEKLTQQSVFAAKQIQKNPRAGAGGGGERAQRQAGEPMFEYVPVAGVEQLRASLR
jgi:hypothetical protein